MVSTNPLVYMRPIMASAGMAYPVLPRPRIVTVYDPLEGGVFLKSCSRKVALIPHISFSVRWPGAVLPCPASRSSALPATILLRGSAHLAMEFIGWSVVVPLSLAALFLEASE